jgi:hypothetical protein
MLELHLFVDSVVAVTLPLGVSGSHTHESRRRHDDPDSRRYRNRQSTDPLRRHL